MVRVSARVTVMVRVRARARVRVVVKFGNLHNSISEANFSGSGFARCF